MLVDYHNHTTRCHHATGTMEAYVERALELGLSEFGFSEHSPWMIEERARRKTLAWDELDAYVDDVKRMQAQYKGDDFKIRLGMEMDYLPLRLEQARPVIEGYNWDYLIASVHHLGLFCLPSKDGSVYYDQHAIEDIADLYYELTGQMIDQRFGDVIGHLDVIKKYGHAPEGGFLRWVEPLIPRILKSEMVVEINTSGLDHGGAAQYPDWEIIEALHQSGVPLMVNSDSHAPEHVGRHFGPVLERLASMGVKELVRFEERQPIRYSFEIPAACLSA